MKAPVEEAPARLLDHGQEVYERFYAPFASRYDLELLARRVSDVVSPVFLAILVWIPLAGAFSPTPWVAAANVVLAILFFFVVPLIVPLVYVRRGMDSIHVHRRELRWLPMLVAVAGYLSFYGIEAYLLRVEPLAQVLLLFMVSALPVIAVTQVWKISIHMSGNTIALATLAHLAPWTWVLAPFVHLPVGWARVRLKAHTPAQVVVGLLYGLGLTLAWFRWFPLS